LAGQIAPLAPSVATFADRAVPAIDKTQEASIKQAGEWEIQQGKAATAWEGTAEALDKAAEALDKAAGKAEGAASQLGWRIFVVTSMGFLLFMLVLLIGLWLWLSPDLRTTKEGAVWLLLRLK
ncbi:IncQ-type mobilization protein MobB, partial [Aeromonas caviae]|uniref:IncQ-type mobilization protein MobB n=1 Tax=Aeromonas caviae TaxID=648 RepID=UPI001FC8613D